MSHSNNLSEEISKGFLDYRTEGTLNDSISIITINGNELESVAINGFIYRADDHTSTLLRKKPAFFGDYESAVKYMAPGWILKTYRTRGRILLLNLTASITNTAMVKNFFMGIAKSNLQYDDLVNVYMTHIMLQVCYGLVDGMENLQLYDFSISFIENYMRTVYRLENDIVKYFTYILSNYSNDKVVPSRVSLRPIDKVLMQNLDGILSVFGFAGIWYSEGRETSEGPVTSQNKNQNRVCGLVNRELYEVNTNKLTCVPSEICIFVPMKSLDIVKMQKYTGSTFVDINIQKNKWNRWKRKKRRQSGGSNEICDGFCADDDHDYDYDSMTKRYMYKYYIYKHKYLMERYKRK